MLLDAQRQVSTVRSMPVGPRMKRLVKEQLSKRSIGANLEGNHGCMQINTDETPSANGNRGGRRMNAARESVSIRMHPWFHSLCIACVCAPPR
jgi:hypothetical protein